MFDARKFFKTSDRGNWQDATNCLEDAFAFGFYGAFSDYTTQTVGNSTTAYAMTMSNTDESFGVRLVNGSKITFDYPGTYNIQWSGQFDSTSTGSEDVSVWLRRNGADVVGSTGLVSVVGSHGGVNGHVLSGWNYVITFAAGEYVELAWSASTTAVRLATYAAQTGPVRPSTASLIVTATQVGAVR